MLDLLKVKYTAHKKMLSNVSRISLEMLIQGRRPNIKEINGAPRAVIDLLRMCGEERGGDQVCDRGGVGVNDGCA